MEESTQQKLQRYIQEEMEQILWEQGPSGPLPPGPEEQKIQGPDTFEAFVDDPERDELWKWERGGDAAGGIGPVTRGHGATGTALGQTVRVDPLGALRDAGEYALGGGVPGDVVRRLRRNQ